MKKPKCENCGTEMVQVYPKGGGVMTWLCPNLQGNLIRNPTSRILQRMLIPCGNIHPDSLSAAFTRHMLETLNEATYGAMSNADLMEQANRLMSGGIEPGDVFDLFRYFAKLGMGLGQTPSYSIESGVYGIVNKSRKRLDNLGIYVYARDAYAAYPELDREQAWNKYVLEKTREAAGVL